ncbi:MAG: M12 family metallo-peptidase [Myxococcota bacterium]
MPFQREARFLKSIEPASIRAVGPPLPSIQTIEVRVYADTLHREQVLGWQARVLKQFKRVNPILESTLGVRLDLTRAEAWSENHSNDLQSALASLIERDRALDGAIIVGLLAPLPGTPIQFDELGLAYVGGRHMVLRAVDDAGEMKALRRLTPNASDDQRLRAYKKRLEHRESSILLHELGHLFGALHAEDPTGIMHTTYTTAMKGYSSSTLEQLRPFGTGEGLTLLIDRWVEAGAFGSARAHLNKARALNPDDPSLWAAWCHFEAQSFLHNPEDPGLALTACEAAWTKERSPQTALRAASVAVQARLQQPSFTWSTRVSEQLDPNRSDPEIWLALAEIQRARGDIEGLRATVSRIADLEEGRVYVEWLKWYDARWRALESIQPAERRARLTHALLELERATRSRKPDGSGRSNADDELVQTARTLGRTFESDLPEAVLCRSLAEADRPAARTVCPSVPPDYVEAHLAWAQLELKDRNVARALEILTRTHRSVSDHPGVRSMLASLYRALGEPEKADAFE